MYVKGSSTWLHRVHRAFFGILSAVMSESYAVGDVRESYTAGLALLPYVDTVDLAVPATIPSIFVAHFAPCNRGKGVKFFMLSTP